MTASLDSNGVRNSPLSAFDRHLLNDFQRDFPLAPDPYAVIARRLGVTEQEVIDGLRRLQEAGAISRVGPVFRPHSIGASTLAAMAVPASGLERIAAIVSAYPEVNHNYEREHAFNLWFVLTAATVEQLHAVLERIERHTGYRVMSLPMLEDYHIDLGFDITAPIHGGSCIAER